MNILSKLAIVATFCSFNSFAAYENHALWIPYNSVPSGPPTTSSDTVNIGDSAVSTISISIPVLYYWTRVASSGHDCEGNFIGVTIYTSHRYWLQFRSGWVTDDSGIKYRFSNPNGWNPSTAYVAGYNTYVTAPDFSQFPGHPALPICFSLAPATVSLPVKTPPVFRATVEIKKEHAIPGNYQVKIPYWWAYEKNFSATTRIYPQQQSHANLVASRPPLYIIVPFKVVSKCKYNAAPINLSHGAMAGSAADGNKTRPYNLNLSCDAGTSVTVKLLGNTPVSGKTANYTKCGTGGVCELNFDDTKYNETMTISGNKTLAITSTYHLNDVSNPIAESFSGSAILQISVN